MADRTRIKVAVLEGNYADLCDLGLPFSLSLQLQVQDLKLSGALWSAKASASGFSVSLYWPTTTAPEKARVKKTRRKRKRGKAKQQAISSISNVESKIVSSSAPVLAASESTPSVVNPIKVHSSPESDPDSRRSPSSPKASISPPLKSRASVNLDCSCDLECVDLAACSDVQYEVKDGVHGVSYRCSSDDDSSWTPVVGRRKKGGPVPEYIRRRFPPDHRVHHSNSVSESDSDSVPDDLDLDAMIPTGANVHFQLVDGTPGLVVRTRCTQSWTPIATRTRGRLKTK